ncbi:uncharacterized protein PHACADRAFT_197477 [Phanerochaete carnosa HHB-10118-sp]|uniref:Uncharacterized protein n=1 Tax=Phanerochaete carnosa (strain HHB-10118-sp) TaxID=650164 RepID=K5WRN5_PHACS|nr:uncharacterized protein PHACADRAFT_197477 [Phanerochaete carnosa HHB-10118-sp]EKM53047.1 hypothetical protein PHACADRAFT_197477 [Phanerochaete carnosa HHB-10118-sp]
MNALSALKTTELTSILCKGSSALARGKRRRRLRGPGTRTASRLRDNVRALQMHKELGVVDTKQLPLGDNGAGASAGAAAEDKERAMLSGVAQREDPSTYAVTTYGTARNNPARIFQIIVIVALGVGKDYVENYYRELPQKHPQNLSQPHNPQHPVQNPEPDEILSNQSLTISARSPSENPKHHQTPWKKQ